MLDWVLDGHVVNPRRLHVQVVQQSVGGKLREGVVDDPGDQLGQLPGDLRSDLLYNLLAVIIEKFIDGVSQQLVLTIEKVVQLDINVTNSEVNVKVGDLQELSSFRIYNGVDERVARHLDSRHLGGEGAAALQRQDEHLAIDPVETSDVHLRDRQSYSQGLGACVDFDVVDDELREALDDHVGECCSHHHWGRALLKLHLLNVHGLRGGKVELWDARPHQRSQVFKCLHQAFIELFRSCTLSQIIGEV